MAWLSSWIKEIIVVVLLATFADMLLPNKSMQRYVKTVIGLFLLMILLTPVLHLFRMNWDTDRLLQSIREQSGSALVIPTNGQAASTSLGAIQQEAERLKAMDGAAAKQIVEDKAKAAIKEEVESRFGMTAREVAVTTEVDSAGTLLLTSVHITLEEENSQLSVRAEEKAGFRPIAPIAVMAPIAPFDQSAGEGEEAQEALAPSRNELEERTLSRRADPIVDYIASTWQVEPERIAVVRERTEEGTSRR
ncbi:stage III sporulation protein AF [Gorillibacterium sp. CAU 1737]|uniref:stage III sporulation protein AF n=1 Tax=Gorillibacterium sp. CAU 1737 TaxID=3140362 RepID=UPI003261A0D9